jgi:hypothetical protein
MGTEIVDERSKSDHTTLMQHERDAQLARGARDDGNWFRNTLTYYHHFRVHLLYT